MDSPIRILFPIPWQVVHNIICIYDPSVMMSLLSVCAASRDGEGAKGEEALIRYVKKPTYMHPHVCALLCPVLRQHLPHRLEIVDGARVGRPERGSEVEGLEAVGAAPVQGLLEGGPGQGVARGGRDGGGAQPQAADPGGRRR